MSFTIRKIDEKPRRSLLSSAKSILLWSLTVGRPLLLIGASLWKEHKEEVEHEKRKEFWKRVAVIVGAIVCAIAVLIFIVRMLILLNVVGVQSFLSVAAADLPEDELGQTNILLLGQGDETHDGVDLTDTMMIASIDARGTKSAVLLSIPRDLYMYNVPGVHNGRINELYRNTKEGLKRKGMKEAEASQQAMKNIAGIIGDLVGLKIQHVVRVDFVGFVQAVDKIGGVTVDVPYQIVDREYPDARGDGYQTFMITAGPHQLDGETALKYARSRHTTSDFGRSARQQQLIAALAEKMKSEGTLTSPSTILGLIQIAGKHVETTMSFGEILALAKAGKSLDKANMINVQLSDQNGLYGGVPQSGGFLYPPPRDQFGGAAVLLPVSIPEFPVTWKQIKTFVTLLTTHRDLFLTPLPIEIRNVSAPSGSAQRLAWELTRYGLDVVSSKNADKEISKKGIPGSAMVIPPAVMDSGTYLSKLLGIPSSKGTDEPLIPDVRPGSILILLGKDYQYKPLQDLLPASL